MHPCRASFRFRRLVHAHEAYARELGSSGVYFCPDTLFPVPASPFLPATLSLSFSLSLSFLAFPSDIFALASLRVLPGCRLPSSVSPASLRTVMSCLPPLASSSTPRHNLPQTLKRSGCFARKSHSGNGIYAAIATTLSQLADRVSFYHYNFSRFSLVSFL